MTAPRTFLVFGATGRTGRHFVDVALAHGDSLRTVVRKPSQPSDNPHVSTFQGSLTDPSLDLDHLVAGVDAVVIMVGNAAAQRERTINAEFMRRLVPAMRRQGTDRLLYQAGGLSAAPGKKLSPVVWTLRNTVARQFIGQHQDNEAVMQYLVDEAPDIKWVVHRAGIGSDDPSKGVLKRSETHTSIATFSDCAAYNYRLLSDDSAIHTCDTSEYSKSADGER